MVQNERVVNRAWKRMDKHMRITPKRIQTNKHLTNLKNCPKWSMCKRNVNENRQNTLIVENGNTYNNKSTNINKIPNNLEISKVIQGDRFVSNVQTQFININRVSIIEKHKNEITIHESAKTSKEIWNNGPTWSNCKECLKEIDESKLSSDNDNTYQHWTRMNTNLKL